jgi:hypothetical protein
MQMYGVNYFSTYSPVAKLASFHIILAIIARYDWKIKSFNFISTYLNGELDENKEIYMQSPLGYESEINTVKHLIKSLYGLKQARRKWYEVLVHVLANFNFQITVADLGVFCIHKNGHLLILAVHVDDCMLTSDSAKMITEFKEKLNNCYALTDLGPIHWLLGIKITCNHTACTISLSQTAYINDIVKHFDLTNTKSYAIPMVPGGIYSKKDAPASPKESVCMKNTPYREVVGSLMYAAIATCPDIAYTVSALSQFLDNPGDAHWQVVKHVLRYLIGTRSHELTYGGECHDLEGYTDTDGTMQEHHHTVSGYAFIMDGTTVSWSLKKQELVTLSTAEAKYVTATHTAKEAIWLCQLLSDIHPSAPTCIPLHCNNQAAIKLATNNNYHTRTKHIDVCYCFICQTVKQGAITLAYCPTKDMVANVLTKALPCWKVVAHALALGIRHACGGVVQNVP